MIIYLVGISISIFAFLTELIKFREVRAKPKNATELNDVQDETEIATPPPDYEARNAHSYEQWPTQIIISSIE